MCDIDSDMIRLEWQSLLFRHTPQSTMYVLLLQILKHVNGFDSVTIITHWHAGKSISNNDINLTTNTQFLVF